jgi:radical SAM superfamily enzyme YgiQ (UPF0313 family)
LLEVAVKLVLVDNLHLEHTGEISARVPQPQLGLISLISIARAAGHDAKLYSPALAVLDGRLEIGPRLYSAMADEILELRPDVVGFTTLGCNFLVVVRVAAKLSARRPHIPILLGGPHATVLSRAILDRFPQFDIVVKHEAEATLIPVLEGLSNWQFDRIPGVAYRDGTRVLETPGKPIVTNLDELPWPAYDVWPMEHLGEDYLRVEAGRGCPFSCTFCSTASFFGRLYRLKSPRRLRAELDDLNGRYGIRRFSLQHDLFTVNRRKVVSFCEELIGLGYEWSCSARMDCVDQELLEQMSAAGCRAIYFGVETGSARLQKSLEKRLDLALFDPTLDMCERLNIRPTLSFITGYPDETKNDQSATLDRIGSTFRRSTPMVRQLHLLTPEPGTKLVAQHSERLQFDGHVSDFNFPPLEATDTKLILNNKSVFVNHYHFQGALSRDKHVFASTVFIEYCRLGALTMSLLLDKFDGSLAQLTSALYEDWLDKGKPTANLSFIIEALLHRLGDAPLISLCRYHKLTWTLRQSLLEARRTRPPEPPLGTIVLSPGVGILKDIHDCPSILSALAGGDKVLTTARVNLLVAITDPFCDKAQNYQISEVMAVILSQIVPICSLRDVINTVGIDAEECESLIRTLVTKNLIRWDGECTEAIFDRSCAEGVILDAAQM